ncbi:unnamed protein product [Amoebophrya sp. A25]|nr:unnamed protein product [Amoebophrya sp. A25]|eukprot:GSA25T00007271001.1
MPSLAVGRYMLHTDVRLGSGGFGEVHAASRRDGIETEEFAIKVGKRGRKMKASTDNNELHILQSIKHPNIVELVDHFVADHGRLHLVMHRAMGDLPMMVRKIEALVVGQLHRNKPQEHQDEQVDARQPTATSKSKTTVQREIKSNDHKRRGTSKRTTVMEADTPGGAFSWIKEKLADEEEKKAALAASASGDSSQDQNSSKGPSIATRSGAASTRSLFITGQAEDIDKQVDDTTTTAADNFFTEYDQWNCALQICLGLEFLHGKNILHRDLKPENILFFPGAGSGLQGNAAFVWKLADFGIGKEVANPDYAETHTVCGTHIYMAPEVLRGERYAAAADMWSLGAVLHYVFTGKVLFKTPAQVLMWKGHGGFSSKNASSSAVGGGKRACSSSMSIKHEAVFPGRNCLLPEPLERSRLKTVFSDLALWDQRENELTESTDKPVQEQEVRSFQRKLVASAPPEVLEAYFSSVPASLRFWYSAAGNETTLETRPAARNAVLRNLPTIIAGCCKELKLRASAGSAAGGLGGSSFGKMSNLSSGNKSATNFKLFHHMNSGIEGSPSEAESDQLHEEQGDYRDHTRLTPEEHETTIVVDQDVDEEEQDANLSHVLPIPPVVDPGVLSSASTLKKSTSASGNMRKMRQRSGSGGRRGISGGTPRKLSTSTSTLTRSTSTSQIDGTSTTSTGGSSISKPNMCMGGPTTTRPQVARATTPPAPSLGGSFPFFLFRFLCINRKESDASVLLDFSEEIDDLKLSLPVYSVSFGRTSTERLYAGLRAKKPRLLAQYSLDWQLAELGGMCNLQKVEVFHEAEEVGG